MLSSVLVVGLGGRFFVWVVKGLCGLGGVFGVWCVLWGSVLTVARCV